MQVNEFVGQVQQGKRLSAKDRAFNKLRRTGTKPSEGIVAEPGRPGGRRRNDAHAASLWRRLLKERPPGDQAGSVFGVGERSVEQRFLALPARGSL